MMSLYKYISLSQFCLVRFFQALSLHWCPIPSCPPPSVPHLRDEELAGGELPPCLLHLAVALQLHDLQLPAALHHALHLRLDLADVEASHGELLLDGAADLHRLQVGGEIQISLGLTSV